MLFAALLLLQEPPTFDALLKELRSGNFEQHDAAAERLRDRFKEWTDADLAKLAEARKDADAAFAARATTLHAALGVRRRLGDRLLKQVKRIDEVVLGELDGRGRVFLTTARLTSTGVLTTDDLKVVVAIAVEQSWDLSLDTLLPLAAGPPRCPAVLPAVEAMLASPKVDHRRRVVDAAAELGLFELSRPIAALVKDTHPDVRRAVARTLSLIEAPEAADVIKALLKDPIMDVRATAAVAAGSLRIAKDELVALEKDESWTVRFAALASLRQQGVDISGRYAEALKHEEAHVRIAAVEAVGRLQLTKDAKELLPLLKDGKQDVRFAAAVSLGRLPPADNENLKALNAIWEDYDERLDLRVAARASAHRLDAKKGTHWHDLLKSDWRSLDVATQRVVIESIASVYCGEALARLDEPFELPREIADAASAILTLIEKSVSPRFESRLFLGRFSKGRRVTPLEILERLLPPDFVLVPDPPRIHIVRVDDARALWLTRLEKK